VLPRYRLNLFAVLAALVTTMAAGQEQTPAPSNPPVAPRAVAPRVQPPKPVTPQQQAAPEQAAKPAVQHPAAPAAARPAEPFTFETVQKLAQDRASKPYRERSTALPDVLAKLNYDQYRDIRFRRTSALWYDHAMFEVQFFHRGFQFDRRVNVYELVNGQVRAVPYNPAMFEFGKQVPPVKLPAELGFAGFRVHYPLNTPAYKDELLVFLGASYFRLLGRNELYGMSARGLAINTASEGGEEFPYFTDFWLVRPDPQQRNLTIYAVLDSPSVAGAYQFEVRPGSTTQVQVSGELYPRRAIEKIGIGALTSMYLYGENSNGRRFDDFRPEVHDSDGLETQLGTGEWAWRPLVNPHQLRVNRFMDEHPRGYGLVQRDRDATHYQDAESYYHLRPSYWVEPLGDWGKGGVELVEIPTDEEIHDNIVAYWVPEAKVEPKKPIPFSYLLSAYSHSTARPPGGRVISTRTGGILAGPNGQALPNVRKMVVDFAGGDLDDLYAAQPVQAQISANGGDIEEITVQRLPQSAIWRVTFKVKTQGEKPADLRCYLTLYGEALTETWTYLWKPPGGA
jgi:periplasmic glucans biosynthesis protein